MPLLFAVGGEAGNPFKVKGFRVGEGSPELAIVRVPAWND